MNHESRDGAMAEISLGLLGDVKRVEVLRGPGGLVYGSGAIAGVINVVTEEYESDETYIEEDSDEDDDTVPNDEDVLF